MFLFILFIIFMITIITIIFWKSGKLLKLNFSVYFEISAFFEQEPHLTTSELKKRQDS